MIVEHNELGRTLSPLIPLIEHAATVIVDALKKGNKLMVMGNGGSASQASHLAGEIVGRYKKERKGWPCISLASDTAILTAVGNDYGFEKIFERQIESFAKQGDVVIALSTSGTSENILRGLEKAEELGCSCITLTGKDGGDMKTMGINIHIPSNNTPRIQEFHLLLIHILCELVEEAMG